MIPSISSQVLGCALSETLSFPFEMWKVLARDHSIHQGCFLQSSLAAPRFSTPCFLSQQVLLSCETRWGFIQNGRAYWRNSREESRGTRAFLSGPERQGPWKSEAFAGLPSHSNSWSHGWSTLVSQSFFWTLGESGLWTVKLEVL